MSKNKETGLLAFENYYNSVYQNRWQSLKESFSKESLYFTFSLKGCKEYYLDAASVLASCCLPLENANNILDLCAAPGGKSLVLSSRMNKEATLLSNEISASRRNRLISVLNESLPSEINCRVKVTGIDGSLACKKFNEQFDAILLDTPCSSERHVFADPKYLNQWTSARIKNLSFRQWSLLSSAFLVLKTDGFLLYSTCAISKEENDGVVKKLLSKYKENVSLTKIDFSSVYENLPSHLKIPKLEVEKTEFGYQILPDKINGAGPLFFTLIQKK